MIIIIFLVALFLYFILKARGVDSISYRFILPYLVIWLIGILMAVVGACGMYIPSKTTVYVLLMHLVTFTIGFSIYSPKRKYSYQYHFERLGTQIEMFTYNKCFIILLIISIIYVLSLLSKFYAIVVFSSWMDARTSSYSGELYGKFYDIIDSFILAPLSIISLSIFGYSIFNKKGVVFYMIVFYLAIYSMLNGGRLAYLNIVWAILFALYSIRVKAIKFARKRTFYALFLFVLLYVVMAFVTSNKFGESTLSKEALIEGSQTLNEQSLAYITGPVVAFDKAISTSWENRLGGFQYGRVITAMVDDAVHYASIVTNLFFNTGVSPEFIVKVAKYTQEPIDIGIDYWNALYTSCLYYYLDFGLFGVFIIPFIFGAFVGKILSEFEKNTCFPLFILLFMCYIIMMTSIQRLMMYSVWNLLFFIFLPKIAKKIKNV